jgi:alpha-L-fucosidase
MKRIILLTFAIVSAIVMWAQGYQPSEAIQRAQREFQDKKFGIFLHWGIYSMLGQGEWVMQNRNINYKEYPKIANGFYPSKFNADEWVQAIKASGAKYITITSRHHDGFSMWNSAASDYNIVKATPFKRDVLKELSDACQRHGIALHFYYSHLDWGRLDYPLGRTGLGTGRPKDKQDWKHYQQFMNDQLTELLTQYGPIGAIWFDGVWDHDSDPTPFDWELRPQYDLIHRLQPSCLVANNHHLVPFECEDVQIFERDLPGENKAGYSGENGISKTLPLESCETMNRTWGYNITDSLYKTPRQIIHLLVGAAGRNANLLLNIGPEPNGELPAEAVSRLKAVGEWMNQYGETIYGTRGGEVEPHPWGVTTRRDNRLFVHILDLNDQGLFLPLNNNKVKRACEYLSRKTVKFTRVDGGIALQLSKKPTEIDYVVELEF